MASRESVREWTEVHRRKQTANKNKEQETTFFVTNIPDEAKKDELRTLFGKFGRVTDVYMGQRKGRNGKNFVFIRYGGEIDAMEMEEKINTMKYKGANLEGNLARFRRKERAIPKRVEETKQKTGPEGDTRRDSNIDHRSFAAAVNP